MRLSALPKGLLAAVLMWLARGKPRLPVTSIWRKADPNGDYCVVALVHDYGITVTAADWERVR